MNGSMLVPGECYLFFTSPDGDAGYGKRLWALFERRSDSRVMLEAASDDLVRFAKYTDLPAGFGYVRRTTRDEMRDFFYNMGFSEAH